MKYELERLAQQAERIILERYGTLDGHCSEAVQLLQELAPGLPMRVLGFEFSAGDRVFEGSKLRHVIAEIPFGEGSAYLVDPTIGQYQHLVPGNKTLPRAFGPQDFYPFQISKGSFVRGETL